jgi:hypothetical protein
VSTGWSTTRRLQSSFRFGDPAFHEFMGSAHRVKSYTG